MKAVWNEVIIAESNKTLVIEGNHYFPMDSVNTEYLNGSITKTVCHWKGEASYYHIDVKGKINRDAAWYYPNPLDAAKQVKNHIAFWKGVEIID